LAPFQDVSVLVWSFVRSGPTEEQGPGGFVNCFGVSFAEEKHIESTTHGENVWFVYV